MPGGFGENFVVRHLNERNVCIGDVVAVGDELILEVSLPRQPCSKLNQRFHLDNFAINTWKLSRTGWYYRVVKEGWVRAGDEIRLVRRPFPNWTIERLQEYLHRDKTNSAMNAELASIDVMGAESRDAFRSRVAKEKAKARKWREFKVVEKKKQTPRIASFVLEAAQPLQDPIEAALMPGAHAKIKLANGLVRKYSVVDGDQNRFQLGVALEENGRGGSKYLHETVEVGHALQLGSMAVDIPTAATASHHIFVAGGIGITAFLSLFEAYDNWNIHATLHYAVRSEEETPFKDRLMKITNSRVEIYDKEKGQRMDIGEIVRTRPWNTRLYFCGPTRLMEDAQRQVRAAGVSEDDIHWEAFAVDASGDPFEAVVKSNGTSKTLKVAEEETLLEVLQKHFENFPSSCEVGNCGTCKATLLSGCVDHRGTALKEEEKANSILTCVSRGVGPIAIEI